MGRRSQDKSCLIKSWENQNRSGILCPQSLPPLLYDRELFTLPSPNQPPPLGRPAVTSTLGSQLIPASLSPRPLAVILSLPRGHLVPWQSFRPCHVVTLSLGGHFVPALQTPCPLTVILSLPHGHLVPWRSFRPCFAVTLSLGGHFIPATQSPCPLVVILSLLSESAH